MDAAKEKAIVSVMALAVMSGDKEAFAKSALMVMDMLGEVLPELQMEILIGQGVPGAVEESALFRAAAEADGGWKSPGASPAFRQAMERFSEWIKSLGPMEGTPRCVCISCSLDSALKKAGSSLVEILDKMQAYLLEKIVTQGFQQRRDQSTPMAEKVGDALKEVLQVVMGGERGTEMPLKARGKLLIDARRSAVGVEVLLTDGDRREVFTVPAGDWRKTREFWPKNGIEEAVTQYRHEVAGSPHEEHVTAVVITEDADPILERNLEQGLTMLTETKVMQLDGTRTDIMRCGGLKAVMVSQRRLVTPLEERE